MSITNGGVHVTNGGVHVSVAVNNPDVFASGGNTTVALNVVLATAEALDFNPTPEDVGVPVTLWTVPEGKRATVVDVLLKDWTFGAGPPWPIGDSIRVVFGWNGGQDVAGWQTEEAGQFPGTVVSIASVTPDPDATPPIGIYRPVVQGEEGDALTLTFTRETGGDPLTVAVEIIGRLEDNSLVPLGIPPPMS